MSTLARALTILVALEHVWFGVLEAFLFDTDFGRRVFRTDPEFSRRARALAANQGLYNGFLAAGLVWSVVAPSREIATFFLVCVVVAGIVGGLTVSRRIALLQALPAAVALAAVWL